MALVTGSGTGVITFTGIANADVFVPVSGSGTGVITLTGSLADPPPLMGFINFTGSLTPATTPLIPRTILSGDIKFTGIYKSIIITQGLGIAPSGDYNFDLENTAENTFQITDSVKRILTQTVNQGLGVAVQAPEYLIDLITFNETLAKAQMIPQGFVISEFLFSTVLLNKTVNDSVIISDYVAGFYLDVNGVPQLIDPPAGSCPGEHAIVNAYFMLGTVQLPIPELGDIKTIDAAIVEADSVGLTDLTYKSDYTKQYMLYTYTFNNLNNSKKDEVQAFIAANNANSITFEDHFGTSDSGIMLNPETPFTDTHLLNNTCGNDITKQGQWSFTIQIISET